MSRSGDLLDLLARSRPARLDPPPDRDDTRAVEAITADERPALMHAEPRARRTPPKVLTSVGAAAAVFAVAITGGAIAARDTSPDPGKGGITSAPGDAGRLLLAAAERSEAAAPSHGQYLTMQTEHGGAVPVSAADGSSYTMIQKGLEQYWLARPGAGRSWVIVQSLGATPATAADEAAWRRAGSPTVVQATKPKPFEMRTTPGKVQGNTVNRDRLFAIGNRNMTQKQLDTLPTSPAALREMLNGTFDGGGDLPTDRDQWLLGVTASLVVGLPVSNPVRGAAYRLLAELPGVRELGAVRDMRGRQGQAIAFVEDRPESGSFEVRLIIDTDTGQALARELRAVQPRGRSSWIPPGTLVGYQTVLVSEHTDDNPPKVDVVN